MKTKFILKIFLPALIFTLTSCGGSSSSNRVTTTPSGTGGDGTRTPATRSQGIIRELKANTHHKCINGESRLAKDIMLHTASAPLGTYPMSINGPFSPGHLGKGRETNTYAGVSVYGDLIFVTKLTDGNRNVLGFNITISMCSLQEYITNERPPQPNSFQAPYGIVVDDSLSCGYESVLSAQRIVLNTTAQNGLPPFRALTTFFPLSCQ